MKKQATNPNIIDNQLFVKYNEYLTELAKNDKNSVDSLDTFSNFLHTNSYSSANAGLLYDIYKSNNLSFRKLQLRKQHPVRNYFLKRGRRLTAALAGIVGAGFIASSFSKWSATTKLLGFMPVAVEGVTIIASITTGLVGGLLITHIISKLSRKIPMWINAHKYGKLNTNLVSKHGKKDIYSLMDKIEKTNQQIYDLKEKKFPLLARAIIRTRKNIHNRDRIHYLMKLRSDMVKDYLMNKDADKIVYGDNKSLKNVLLDIEKFINRDITYSKERLKNKFIENLSLNKKLPVVENIDIYGDSTNRLIKLIKKHDRSMLESIKKQLKSKHNSALDMCNRNDDITSKIFGLQNNICKWSKKDNSIIITNDNKTIKISKLTNVDKVKDVEQVGNKIVITYNDNSTKSYQINKPQSNLSIQNVSKKKTSNTTNTSSPKPTAKKPEKTEEEKRKALEAKQKKQELTIVKEKNNQTYVCNELNIEGSPLIKKLLKKYSKSYIKSFANEVNTHQINGELITKTKSKFKDVFNDASLILAESKNI